MRSDRGDGMDFEPGPRLALPSPTPVTKALLWINGGIGILCLIAGTQLTDGQLRPLYDWLGVSPARWGGAPPWAPLWQLGTYGFLHSAREPMHLLFNLLGLYFFGTMLEGIVGSRRFAWLYMASVVLGGAVELAWSLALGRPALIFGASAGVMFLLVAVATLRPHTPVIFFFFPLKLRTVALIYVALDVWRMLNGGVGVAVGAHLAGAAFGFLGVWRRWIWVDPLEVWERRREVQRVEREHSDAERLDHLLARIHERGIGSLSRSERSFLKRMSSRREP